MVCGMVRVLAVVVVVVSMRAAADIGPPPPECNVPSSCTVCSSPRRGLSQLNEDAGLSDCQSAALDAGLTFFCKDTVEFTTRDIYCPAELQPRGSGCAVGASTSMLFGLAALWTLRRQRR